MQNTIVVVLALGGALVWKTVDLVKFLTNAKNNAQAKNGAITQFITWAGGIGVTFLAASTTLAHQLNLVGGVNLKNAPVLVKLFLGVAAGSWASILYDFKNALDNTSTSVTPSLLTKASRRFGNIVLNPSPYDPTGGSTIPPGGSTPLGSAIDPGHVLGTNAFPVVLQGTFVPGNVIAPGGSVTPQGPFAPGSAVAPGGNVAPGGKYVEPGASTNVPVNPTTGPWVPPGGTGGTAGTYTATRPEEEPSKNPVPPEQPPPMPPD